MFTRQKFCFRNAESIFCKNWNKCAEGIVLFCIPHKLPVLMTQDSNSNRKIHKFCTIHILEQMFYGLIYANTS